MSLCALAPADVVGTFSLEKWAADAVDTTVLSGTLYLSKSGWILLSVPNAFVTGLFGAMSEPGVELPLNSKGVLDAHISVIRPEELEQIPGGAGAITERGKQFYYQLGPMQAVTPNGWAEMSRVWFVKVKSSALEKLRKSYGLSPLPKNNEFNFHITIAVRRRSVLYNNDVSKAATIAQELAHDSVGAEEEVRVSRDGASTGVSGVAGDAPTGLSPEQDLGPALGKLSSVLAGHGGTPREDGVSSQEPGGGLLANQLLLGAGGGERTQSVADGLPGVPGKAAELVPVGQGGASVPDGHLLSTTEGAAGRAGSDVAGGASASASKTADVSGGDSTGGPAGTEVRDSLPQAAQSAETPPNRDGHATTAGRAGPGKSAEDSRAFPSEKLRDLKAGKPANPPAPATPAKPPPTNRMPRPPGRTASYLQACGVII